MVAGMLLQRGRDRKDPDRHPSLLQQHWTDSAASSGRLANLAGRRQSRILYRQTVRTDGGTWARAFGASLR